MNSQNIELNSHEVLFKAIQACRRGRDVLLKYYGHLEKVEEKAHAGLVSEADRESEKVIQAELKKNFPEMDFLGEESAYSSTTKVKDVATDKPRWILDPLDGTTNYVHRFPIFCISLGLEFRGEIQVAVIDVPMLNETYTAIRGKGAWLNGNKIQVSVNSQLQTSLLATGFFGENHESLKEQMEIFSKLVKQTRGIRRAGAAAYDLCMVARGVFDGFWEKNLSPWDTAAGILLVTEAGGQVTTFRGKNYDPYKNSLIASNGKLNQTLVGLMKDCLLQDTN
jgi:myo-inositol-1(or 4)-monophosphatase